MGVYLVLFCAIALEVIGTLLLPTTQSFTKFFPSLISLFSYCLSIYLLSIVVQKLPIAIVYASWALVFLRLLCLDIFFTRKV